MIRLRERHIREYFNPYFSLIVAMTVLVLMVFQSAFAIPLTQSECDALGTTKVATIGNYTFICGYPFNATIPFGTNLVWIDTQQWQGKYHHTITSVNGTFAWKDQTVVNVLISNPLKVYHVYKYYDELNSNQTGYITVVPRNETSSVTILDPSQVRIPVIENMTIPINSTNSTNSTTQSTNNNSTPLMLPPSLVGLPTNSSWVNPNTDSNNTTSDTDTGNTTSNITPVSNESSTQCVSSADISTLSKEIKKLEVQNLALETQLDKQNKMTDSIFGMLTKLLHNFNLG